MLVLDLALMGVDDDGAVLGGQQLVVAVAEQGADDAFELPGRGGAGRVVELPGDVDLEHGLDVFRQGVGVAGEVHGLSDVVEDGGCAGVDDGDRERCSAVTSCCPSRYLPSNSDDWRRRDGVDACPLYDGRGFAVHQKWAGALASFHAFCIMGVVACMMQAQNGLKVVALIAHDCRPASRLHSGGLAKRCSRKGRSAHATTGSRSHRTSSSLSSARLGLSRRRTR